MVGGLLVAAAAVGTFAAAAQAGDGDGTAYLVAARDLPPGHTLRADDLATVELDLPVDQAQAAFSHADELVDAVTLGPVAGGELLQAGALALDGGTAPPSAELSFSVTLDRAVGGDLRPGERVDLLATYGVGDEAWTTTVLTDAVVLSAVAPTGMFASGDSTVVTLALPRRADVLAAAHAVDVGAVTVVRTTRADDEAPVGEHRPSPQPATELVPEPATP